MIPRPATACTALADDRYSGEMVEFLRDNRTASSSMT